MFIDATYEGDLMAPTTVSKSRRPSITSSRPRSRRTKSPATCPAACCPMSRQRRRARRAMPTTACRPTASVCA
jgi:hypothetical protein